MSINVTVNGNHLNIRRGRMTLSDLDQIKKNERDRRRRLRLEQVRQQSKEISNRLLERTKNVAKEELKRLQNNDKLSLRQIYNGKIMEVHQKYQEDMADIGEAHISAALEPDHEALMEEREKRNNVMAVQRGKEAIKQIKTTTQQKESAQQQHQERLRQVREVENLRSTMVANLPKKTIPEEPTICISIRNESDEENKRQKSPKKKTKKLYPKQSPGKVSKTYVKAKGSDLKIRSPVAKSKPKILETPAEPDSSVLQERSVPNSVTEPLAVHTRTNESEYGDRRTPRKEVANITTKVDKPARYNPEDYVQTSSESTSSDSSSSSFSDDSSYFSDSGEQYVRKETKTAKQVKCPTSDRVQLYDHSNRHSNRYDQPVGVVEKIHTWNEPSAIDLAQEMERAQVAESRATESRKCSAQKRGEDAALREKVRRDYQTLMQNLDQLASEERKLKASQVEHYPKQVYVQEERRKVLRDQHKKRLNRALRSLLNGESLEQPTTSRPVERQITLTPIQRSKNVDGHVAWEEPTCCVSQRTETDKGGPSKGKEDEEISREEQILDMLKKVERQKRLLLQEFGTDLPNDIFSASMKPLFERDKSVQAHTTPADSKDAHVDEPSSPEIRVIDASLDGKRKKDKAEKKEEGNTVKKVEIAVQTTRGDESVVQDKGTQVELEQEKKRSESSSVSDEIQRFTKRYPLEPQITVIRPEVDSSSDSTISETIDAITDLDKQSPKATPKKKKYSVKTVKQQTPTKMLHKSCSTRSSKSGSPAKKFSKSKSQYGSPKKMADDVPSKKIKMYVDKNGLNIKVKPPQVAEVSVDVSTQSAQVYSTGSQVQTARQQWVQSKSKRIKIKDISDTSTSFASPPPIKPKDILEALSNNISILEMLDSSANESMKLLKRDISPVSTPETPSPRTMRMPSNIPHPDRIKKFLRYSSTDSQTNDNNVFSSSNKNDYSTSTESSEYRRNERISTESATPYLKAPHSAGFCLCNNPECREMHAKFDEIRSYALKNCPQILKKYEDLQTTCAERIVSLNNLIEKVRNEQKGMEFSMIDTGDETSLMQLPPPRVPTNDLQSVHRLVENIEAIHNQLAKTLIESQRIIQNSAVIKEAEPEEEDVEEEEEEEEIVDKIIESEKATSTKADDESKSVIYAGEQKVEVEKAKAKPRIISEEKVNIQLNRFKIRKSPQMMTSTPERDTWISPNHYEEEMIEKLSKEILEQSKSLNNNLLTSREIYNSTAKHSIQTSTDNENFMSDISKVQRTDTAIRKVSNKEVKKTKNFVPMLSDIPKLSKTIDNSMHNNGRSKPPVSLLSGPYRAEIESSGHELSTIIEFDTPDTVNKSQNNKSPLLSEKTAAGSRVTKSTAIVKPSEHVTPLDSHNRRLEKKSSVTSTTERRKEASMFLDSPKPSKNVGTQDLLRDEEKKKEDNVVAQETSDKKLQCDTVDQKSLQIEDAQPFCSTSTDPNKEYNKDNKDKITSTSSNSFSELSGVSQIASTPSSTILKYASSPEEMEIALKKLGLGWAITTLKKTREASALSSSSNSDVTPINTAKRIISPVKKQFDSNYGLPDFSDVSSISIKEASKSTEQAVLLKGRTSTPKLQNSNSNSGGTNTSSGTNNSGNFREPDDALIIPNISLAKTKSSINRLENL